MKSASLMCIADGAVATFAAHGLHGITCPRHESAAQVYAKPTPILTGFANPHACVATRAVSNATLRLSMLAEMAGHDLAGARCLCCCALAHCARQRRACSARRFVTAGEKSKGACVLKTSGDLTVSQGTTPPWFLQGLLPLRSSSLRSGIRL